MRVLLVVVVATACLVSRFAAAEPELSAVPSSNVNSRHLAASTPTPPPTAARAGANDQTCCQCRCVIPGKDFRSPACKARPNCVGLGAPTYSTKNICAPGANRPCDSVCFKDNGSWKELYPC